MVLFWDKPEKIMSVEQWDAMGFDDGPRGAYVPNMSKDDQLKWKAKLVGQRVGPLQVEIRKSIFGTATSCQMLIIVALDGWRHKAETPEGKFHAGHPEVGIDPFYTYRTKGLNVRLTMNGPAMFSFEEFEEFHQAVAEAKAVLESLSQR